MGIYTDQSSSFMKNRIAMVGAFAYKTSSTNLTGMRG
jgi:hypothetical protein